MKKLLLTLTIIAALALGLFGLTACGTNGTGAGGANGTGNSAAAQAAEEAYGFSAASAGAILSSMNANASLSARSTAADAAADAGAADDAAAEIDELNGYMLLVEGLLEDGAFGASAETSDREGYAVKMTVSYKDLEGDTIEYVLYYNETLVREEYDRDDDDDEVEQIYRLEGVMLLGGSEYSIEGRRNVESERGESESEEQFRVNMGDGRSMLVEHEAESERGESEQEYVYSIYDGSGLVERSSFEYEEERGDVEIEFRLTKDGNTKVFYFEQENGRIEIKVGDRNSAARYFVTIDETGNYVYTVAGGGSYNMHRFDFDD